eukprot:2558208-Alexandrium_andersonii.AAC.1
MSGELATGLFRLHASFLKGQCLPALAPSRHNDIGNRKHEASQGGSAPPTTREAPPARPPARFVGGFGVRAENGAE